MMEVKGIRLKNLVASRYIITIMVFIFFVDISAGVLVIVKICRWVSKNVYLFAF